MLLEMREEQAHNRELYGKSYHTEFSDYIYVDAMGELVKPGFITQHFRFMCDKNGLKHLRFFMISGTAVPHCFMRTTWI